MTPQKINFNDLHLLWPRSDGAVRFLAYLIKPLQNGEQPRFTDQFLAKKFHKHPETIARWRARWTAMGILKSLRRAGRTYYEIDLAVLREKIAEAKQAQEQQEDEERGKAIARRVDRDTEIAQDLRQQCQEAISTSPHFADSSTQNSGGQQRTEFKEHFVLTEPGKQVDWDPMYPDRSEPPEPEPERNWFLAAAQRLVTASGERWNQTLQTALEKLEGDRLINLVSACWEQQLKGNIQNLPRWLNKAAQKATQGISYRPSKKFRLPKELPAIAPPITPSFSQPQSQVPDWLPGWAKLEVEVLLQAIGSFTWIDETEDGFLVRWPGERLLLVQPQGLY